MGTKRRIFAAHRFGDDGMADVLWRDNTSGGVAIWLMNGATIISSLGVGNVPTNWVIAGTGGLQWRQQERHSLAR